MRHPSPGPSPSLSKPRPRAARRAAAVAVTAAVTLTGLATTPTATSAVSADCPQPYPVANLTRGQQVSGLTVTSGTEPSTFSGEVIGVIDDGIAPGLDMVMARLTSPELDRVGGIWQGMSGSPVYASDGRLIGAVSYGLAWGPSQVAGITPAEEMYRLLDSQPADTAARTTLRMAAQNDSVDLSPTMQARVAASTRVSAEQAEDGMSRLPIPFGVSGMVNAKRLGQAKRAFGLEGVRVYRTGAVATANTPIAVVPGGNLAASLAYGDLSAVGVGTATAVCGEQVLAFGHPMNFSGPSQMTMHGADALYIQEESLGAPFKVANAAAPIGGISKDRLSGLFGLQSPTAVPGTTNVTSYVEVPGEWSRTGTTRISVPDAVPDMAAFHMLVDQDRVFDAISQGTATVSWTVSGKRLDGRPFTFRRTDRYASEYDISFEPTFDLFEQLARIHFNEVEDVTIGSVLTTSTMERKYAAYSVAKVQVLNAGRWQDLRTDRPLLLRAGTTKRFRVSLTSAALGPARVAVALAVPDSIGRKSGMLEILGGNSFYGEGEGFFEEEGFMNAPAAPVSFEGLLRRLREAPRNDHVMARLTLFKRDGSTIRRSSRVAAPAVVNGGVTVEVMGRP